MRTELLIKRNKLKKEVEELNKVQENCSRSKSFDLSKQKQEKINKYKFINNLLKVIK